MDQELYKELLRLKSEIKMRGKAGGRAPAVCADEALLEIARLMPREKEELLYISGLGKTFVEKYGEEFMALVNRFRKDEAETARLGTEVKEVLKNLENRLVNINKRNRLLYIPKLTARTAIDLMDGGRTERAKLQNVRLIDFIKRFDENRRYKLCETGQSEGDDATYRAVSGLMREVGRDVRETGENNLFVAYPFVIGKMSGEDFNVRAPLALFPVEAIVTPESVCLKMDTSKDVLYNSSLILSYYKFNRVKAELPDCTAEPDGGDFMSGLIDFYEKNGIKLARSDAGPSSFTEYKAGQFPKFKFGEFIIEENAVLGRFPMYSGALQKDFRDIIEGESINELLNNLLEGIYEIGDMYSDSEDCGEKAADAPEREANLNYINDLNISQENAILNINRGDRLVVQGPPGTGKSQTITSMIADFVNKGKNVLMVSQKKAALDVIYSRLGRLSRYALMLSDVKNKEDFYEQLYRIFSATDDPAYDNGEFVKVSDTIDNNLHKLEVIADRLYYDAAYGVGVYKIYEENLTNPFNKNDAERNAVFSALVPRELMAEGYPALKKISAYLDNAQLSETLTSYYALTEQFDWLADVHPTYSNMKVAELLKEIDEIITLYCAYKSARLFRRARLRGRFRKRVRALVRTHFSSYDKGYVKRFVKDPVHLYNGVKNYTAYFAAKTKHDELTAAQKLYFGATYSLSCALGVPPAEANRPLLDYISVCYIDDFEAENREVLVALDNFDVIIRDVSTLISQKKELTRARLKATLVKSFRANVDASKRKGEMQRVIDGKRKWNVARFIDKFGFELFKGIRVWLMTPEVVSEVLPLQNGLFDLLIFDEASQIYIERGIPSIARAKKVVIAGDHKQLRPSSLGSGRMDYDEELDGEEGNAALEEESLLDLARFRYPEVLLNYHYRSKYEELIAFSNYAFYKGRLNISPNVDSPAEPPIRVCHVEGGVWDDRTNRAEAEKVLSLIKEFFASRKGSESLGVITFNSAQRDLIQDLVDAECLVDPAFHAAYHKESQRTEGGEDVGLFIKNIENVQGDERDVIFFSLAYAKNTAGRVVRNFGWLNQAGGENRLNVAISRAKKKVVVVTSIYPAELKVDDLKNEGPRILKKYLEYCYAVSDGNTEGAKQVLRSFGNFNTRTYEYNDEFVFEVYKELLSRGFDVERNVGIGGYKIDIAVKDETGRYLVGIECDSNLYHLSHVARERDVHRQKYLESRGWTLYRVWSSSWWRDRGAEIAKLSALMNKTA